MWLILVCAALAGDDPPVTQQQHHEQLEEIAELIKLLEDKKQQEQRRVDCETCPAAKTCTCDHEHAPEEPTITVEAPVLLTAPPEPPPEPPEKLVEPEPEETPAAGFGAPGSEDLPTEE